MEERHKSDEQARHGYPGMRLLNQQDSQPVSNPFMMEGLDRGDCFQKIYEQGPLGLAFIGQDYRFSKVNPMFCEITGYPEQELTALTPANITHPEDMEMDESLAKRVFKGEIPFYRTVKRYIKKTNEILWVQLTVSIIRDQAGKRLYDLLMIEDITEGKQAEEALSSQRIYDPLTGLYNRQYFNARIKEEIARAERNQQTLAILLCDLDDFDLINAKKGRQTGDEILKTVARCILESTRGTDLAFRWGGDEFLIALSETTPDGVLVAAQRFMRRIRKIGQAMQVDLSVSIGAAVYPQHGTHPDELIRIVNSGLKAAKGGTSKIHVASDTYRLDEHSVKVVFQPIVDIQQIIDIQYDQVFGYEALSRDPEGYLSNRELFEKYKAVGKLHRLKWFCLGAQIKTAELAGLKRVFINTDFNGLGEIEPLPIPPEMEVILEISNLELLNGAEDHLKITKRWRSLGYKFAIDDFGASEIVLPFIENLAPEYIKLDRSALLQGIASEKSKKSLKILVRAIRNYAKEGIIAEGVENEKELKVIQDLGINFVQGFLFGKPQEMPASAINHAA
jgi:diguanylate cyclase (GGDEF)-like protein/PAS domain S-box-containing protein